MFALPAPMAVTIPLLFTVATAVLSLLHTPPAVPLLVNEVVELIHTAAAPLMVPAVAVADTVIVFVVLDEPQPLTEYVMLAEPALIPVTTPVVAFTIAMFVLSLLHVPPCVPLVLSPKVCPAHTARFELPFMVPAVTSGFTVTVVVTSVVPQAFVAGDSPRIPASS